MKAGDRSSQYLDLLGLSADNVTENIAELVSDRTDDEHKIRSSILDIHFTTEFELKRFLYHSLRSTISFADKSDRDTKAAKLNRSVSKLSMGGVLSLLEAGLRDPTWAALEFAWSINGTRNKLAHKSDLKEVLYKGRSPFLEPDCLAQMYIDLWDASQSFAKAFEFKIEMPLVMARYYHAVAEIYETKYGPLSKEERPSIPDYPEW